MNISQAGIDLIKSYEGYHRALPNGDCTTYYCPAGVLTIGYGSTNMDGGDKFQPGAVWTYEQACQRLINSIAHNYEPSVQKEMIARNLDLTQAQYDVLVSFTYNCGAGNLAKLLNHGDVANGLSMFVRGGGQVLPGLVRRRAQERGIWLQGYSADQAQIVEQVTPSEFSKAINQNSSKIGLIRKTIGWTMGGIDLRLPYRLV